MKGWKTVMLGIAVGLTAMLSNADMQAFISQHIPSIGASLGTAIIILRAVTSSAIFAKE